jgi:hypothetical protein
MSTESAMTVEAQPRALVGSFNYDALPAELAGSLRAQAERIKKRVAQHTQDMIETGLDLLAVKGNVQHGMFTDWVESELGMPIRTAQAYMRAAEWANSDEAKSANFALLRPTTVQRLSSKSTPTEIRKAVLARVQEGQMVADKDVATMLWARRERLREEKRKAKEASLSPRTRESRIQKEERIERELKEQRERRQRERMETDAAADELARILRMRLTPEEWERAKAIVAMLDVFMGRYESGVHLVPITKSMEAVEVSMPAGAEEQQPSVTPEAVAMPDRDVYADLEIPPLLRRSAA